MIRAIVALASLVTLLSGCDRSPAPVPSGTQRIVALSPATTQVLRDLDVSDRLVGRHGYDRWAGDAIAICGDQSGLDYEALLRANPTDVLLEWGARPIPERLTSMAETNGWRIENVATTTLDEVLALVRTVGRLTEREDASEALVRSMEASFDRPVDPASRPERLVLLMGVDPPALIGPGSVHHEILERMGVGMALETGAPYMELDGESLAALRPDVILLVGGLGEELSGPVDASRLGVVGRLSIPAVEQGRVIAIGHPMALIPSSSLQEVADEMRSAINSGRRSPPG